MTYLLQAEVRHHDSQKEMQTLSERMHALELSHQNLLTTPLGNADRASEAPQVDPSQDESALFLSSDSSEAADQSMISQQPILDTKETSLQDTSPFKELQTSTASTTSPFTLPSLGASPSDWLLASLHSRQTSETSPFRSVGNSQLALSQSPRLQATLFPSPPKPTEDIVLPTDGKGKTMNSSPVSVLQVRDSPEAIPTGKDIDMSRKFPSPTKAPQHPFKHSYDARVGSFWEIVDWISYSTKRGTVLLLEAVLELLSRVYPGSRFRYSQWW